MTQLRLFENKAVEEWAASLGSVQIEEEDAEFFGQDEMVVLVMVASVGGVAFDRSKKDGHLKRQAKLSVHNMRVATGDMRHELIDIFGLMSDEQLTLTLDAVRTDPVPDVDADTGEILPTQDEDQSGFRDPELEISVRDDRTTHVERPPVPTPASLEGEFFTGPAPSDAIRSTG